MISPKLRPQGVRTLTLQEIHIATGGPTEGWQYDPAKDNCIGSMSNFSKDLVLHVIQLLYCEYCPVSLQWSVLYSESSVRSPERRGPSGRTGSHGRATSPWLGDSEIFWSAPETRSVSPVSGSASSDFVSNEEQKFRKHKIMLIEIKF